MHRCARCADSSYITTQPNPHPPPLTPPPSLQADSSYIAIPGLTYGTTGAWGVAFWVKMHLDNSTSLDYFYSHNNSASTDPGTSPNQVGGWVGGWGWGWGWGLIRIPWHPQTPAPPPLQLSRLELLQQHSLSISTERGGR